MDSQSEHYDRIPGERTAVLRHILLVGTELF